MNIIGVLNLLDIGVIIVYDYESINGEMIVCFFCKLRESYLLVYKFYIILDGVGYYCSDLVRDVVFVFNIELYYFLFYSLNFNLIEWLWKVMNEKLRNNVYFKRKWDFKVVID